MFKKSLPFFVKTILTKLLGIPLSFNISINFFDDNGVCSDGFNTNEVPEIIAGKFYEQLKS